MSKVKAYKFRIYPTKSQAKIIDNNFRISNFIYNHFLATEIEIVDILKAYGLRNGKNKKDKHLNKWRTKYKLWFNRFDGSIYLTNLAKTDKFSFLKEFPSTGRTYTLKALEKAFDGMKRGGGYPKFKNKNSAKSYTVQIMGNTKINPTHIKHNWYKINLVSTPKNPLKNVKINIHNTEFINNLNTIKFNSCTFSKNAKGDYFISYQVVEQHDTPEQKEIKKETSIGIDLGVVRPITTSRDIDFDDELFNKRLQKFKKNSKKLKHLQQILSKKRLNNKNWKESNKYKRIKHKISNLQTKITNQRNWMQHNITRKLVNLDNVDTFILEELNIKGMTKRSAKGKSNNKSGLNRVMLDVGLATIKTQLEYKANWEGKNVVTVDPKYTSQRCNNCGYINKLNRQTQSKFKCVKCNHTDNADKNASKNIKDKFFNYENYKLTNEVIEIN